MWGPIGWAWDQISGFAGDIATAGFQVMIGGITAWVIDAVVWIVGGVFDYFIDAADPNVQADWFITGDGPYATSASIGSTLMVGFVFAGITQGVLAGDVGGMLRRMALDLPLSVLGMVGLVTFTQALIRLTDELSTWVLSGFQDEITDFTIVVTTLTRLSGGVATALVVVLLGLLTVLAGLALIGELAVRSALIYIVVALAPFVFAAQLWPALRATGRKLLQVLCALILSKLVIAVALAVSSAAAVGSGSGGEVTALPEPEAMAEDPGGSVTQAVGILLSATVAFAVAALSPLMVARLFPLAEEAAIAQGIRGAPVRAAQQALSTAYSVEMLRHYRFRGLASGRARGQGDEGDDGGGGPAAGRGMGSPPGRGPTGGSRTGAGSRGGGQARAKGSGGKATGGSGAAGGAKGASAAGTGAAGGSGAAGASGAAGGAAAAAGPAGVAAAAAVRAKGAAKKASRATKQGAGSVQARAGAASDQASPSPSASTGTSSERSSRRTAGSANRPSPPRQGPSGTPSRRPGGGAGGSR